MIGQGSPNSCTHSSSRRFPGVLFGTLLVLALLYAPTATAQQADIVGADVSSQIRLRISWGGGASRQWQGKISVLKGKLSDHSILALSPDAPGTVILANGQLHINHWKPTTYGGCDVSLTVKPDDRLKIELSAADDSGLHFEQNIKVSELSSNPFRQDLDQANNRIAISRAPGDKLPVEMKKDHLVFAPGEVFEFGIRANRTQWSTKKVHARIKLAGKSRSLRTFAQWNRSFSFDLDAHGSAPIHWLQIPVPQEEGVYEIQISMDPAWYQSSLTHQAAVQRSIQFVVIDDQSRSTKNEAWYPFATIDPTNSRQNYPFQFGQMPRRARNVSETISNDLRKSVMIDQKPMVKLLPGGWQAIPITIDKPNQPHLIEIEFRLDQAAAVGISFLEPDALGQIQAHGADSGIFIPDSIVQLPQPNKETYQHRLIVWPRNKQGYLLIANRHADNAAHLGPIQLSVGPQRLPAAEQPKPRQLTEDQSKKNRSSSRKFMAFYETPTFPENFGAIEKIDAQVGQPLDDWERFYQGTDRFIQHLKSGGYRGAFVTVACDGGTIYPSQFLGASPKFDSGIFFTNGQDPIRKDILEMMFRMFEREGLILVPALALSNPIPAVEKRKLNSTHTDHIGLVDYNQNLNSPEIGNRLPIYNPLNRQVQKAVTDIVEELASRYHTSAAYEGVAIICRPDTVTLLPGRQWGYDPMTTRLFLQTQSDLTQPPTDWNEIQTILFSTHQQEWLNWRSEQMSHWYRTMLTAVQTSNRKAKLYIAPVDLYRNQEISSSLSPGLHSRIDFRQQMQLLGLEPELFSSLPGLELLNPRRFAPGQTLANERTELNLKRSPHVDQFFEAADSPGELFTHRDTWIHFAQLEQKKLFGPQSSPLMRLQPLTPARQWNRLRFLESLRGRDIRMLIDGGWTLSNSQHPELQELISVFSQLPDQRFSDIQLDAPRQRYQNATLPVIARQYQEQGKSWWYAVNASPWPAKVTLNCSALTAESQARLRSLSNQPFTIQQATDGIQIKIEMEPMSMNGMEILQDCELTGYQFELPASAADPLRKQIHRLQAKLIASTKVPPLGVIKNPEFELFDKPSLSNWDVGQQSTAKIQLDTQDAFQGTASLRIRNETDDAVWIRSNVFSPPKTGRLSISVWLKTEHPSRQPPLRLAIEGKLGDASYYRFGSVGSLSASTHTNQINSQWQRFVVHFDDLPVNQLENVRIGVDMMGPGQVNLDHVEIYDRWFDAQDAKAITQRLASCGPLLAHPETIESCRLLLDGYWMRFLDEHIQTGTAPKQKIKTAEIDSADDNQQYKPVFRRRRKLGGTRR